MSTADSVTGAIGKAGSVVVKGLSARDESGGVGAHAAEKGNAMFGSHAGCRMWRSTQCDN